MEDWINLLLPKFLAIKHRLKGAMRKSPMKLLAMAALAVGFWAIIFILCRKVLLYFQSVGPFGDLLNYGLLSLMFLLFFSILLFNNIFTALSTFFLSEDLPLLLSRPVSLSRLYYARLIETIFYSSWMVVFLAVPVLGAYGWVYESFASAGYYLVLPAVFLPFLIIPSAIGILVTMILVNVFPARSTKDILILIPIFFAVGFYFLVRFLQTEHLIVPDSISGLVEYLRARMNMPSRSFLQPALGSFWVAFGSRQ
jgi:ABC-2 type transport system permease protein